MKIWTNFLIVVSSTFIMSAAFAKPTVEITSPKADEALPANKAFQVTFNAAPSSKDAELVDCYADVNKSACSGIIMNGKEAGGSFATKCLCSEDKIEVVANCEEYDFKKKTYTATAVTRKLTCKAPTL